MLYVFQSGLKGNSFYFTLSFGVHASEGAKLEGRGLRG
jgi:hypothetical protein